ncbi:hypothetical protein A9G24_00485 [Gilliamella sp. App6-5]|jgi:hypothetical protein|uniref:DUF1176 domain-containing protein n=1 Tax=Gilliamella sp. App6-5 TaxID=3120232 RepID=UPI00080E77C3|nr:DUF1176 domain-containing protein [Gilliamella apicola]OCG16867.1 hypothetical protein A9G24_00485 [Gilliamella apicola]
MIILSPIPHFIKLNTMRFYYYLLLTVFSTPAIAWDMVCDNTLTCRVIEYSDMSDTGLIKSSILFERKAGANQPVEIYVRTKNSEEDIEIKDTQQLDNSLALFINQEYFGELKEIRNNIYQLSQHQATKVIQAFTKNEKVIFRNNRSQSSYTNGGFYDVMLTMDKKQGRVGTTGAVIAHGNKNESNVYAPIPVPTIKKGKVIDPEQSQELNTNEVIKIFPQFKKRYIHEAKCDAYDLEDPYYDETQGYDKRFRLIKLDNNHDLLETWCWFSAYNSGNAYWIISNTVKPSNKNIKFINNEGNTYKNGTISSIAKLRGEGDCLEKSSWTWNGHKFMLSSNISTGECLGFDGGAWELPSFISKIK